MAKLKCDRHKRRIHAFDGVFVHRNGESCDSPTANIMGESYTPSGVQQFGMVRPERSVK